MRVLVAIGGNSMIEDPARTSVADQYQAIARTAEHLAAVVADGHELVVTHGNGPQVGFMLLRSELSASVLHEVPLDSIDADTQGAIGYQIQQALGNALRRRGVADRVVSLVTQVVVAADDPAFAEPSKPIGRAYEEEEARARMAQGWQMVFEKKRGWRRVVPSPQPLRVVESWAVRGVLSAGAVAVACGGGGIPVVETPEGLQGVQAVIDKDRASALLAHELEADVLVFSTGVDRVFLDFGGPDERPLDRLPVAEAERYLAANEFPPGSMGPKVQGAVNFIRAGGGHARQAVITSPEHLTAALRDEAGTRVVA